MRILEAVVMVALVIAAFSAYLINPAVAFLLARTRLSRAWAVNIVYFTALILLLGLPVGFTPIFFDEAQLVVEDLLDLTSEVNAALSQPVLIGELSEFLAESAIANLPSWCPKNVKPSRLSAPAYTRLFRS